MDGSVKNKKGIGKGSSLTEESIGVFFDKMIDNSRKNKSGFKAIQ